ncbi:cytidine/deoxycytidylate deaminase [Nemania sp. FL0916]|nr:cytidine/deoxycytidylate deaminase [Nemania sp. FL0916]
MPDSYHPTLDELTHLERCIALAAEALEAGDAPFGSVLAENSGAALHEDRNRIATTGDATRHPEFELARWAAANMTPEARAMATVYTSGEHCAMCSAAHAWVGLGRIVYVASATQLEGWTRKWVDEEGAEGKGTRELAVKTLPVQEVVKNIVVDGPVKELEGEIVRLHRRYAGLDA